MPLAVLSTTSQLPTTTPVLWSRTLHSGVFQPTGQKGCAFGEASRCSMWASSFCSHPTTRRNPIQAESASPLALLWRKLTGDPKQHQCHPDIASCMFLTKRRDSATSQSSARPYLSSLTIIRNSRSQDCILRVRDKTRLAI